MAIPTDQQGICRWCGENGAAELATGDGDLECENWIACRWRIVRQRDIALQNTGRPHSWNGHSMPCYYCGQPCDGIAASPGRWPIPLTHADDPGVVKWHHIECVTARLNALDGAREVLAFIEARATLGVDGVIALRVVGGQATMPYGRLYAGLELIAAMARQVLEVDAP